MGTAAFIDGVHVSELNERMARMEANQEHQQRVLDKLSESSEQNTTALTKMASILECMANLEPRVSRIEKKAWAWGAVIAFAAWVIPNIDKIKSLMQ
ncbi:MAG: hypothetical protein ACRCXB_05970 [Aeromonadaceae bacterium]